MLLGRPYTDYLFSFALWAVSVTYTLIAFTYPADARAIPGLVGIGLVTLSTIDVVSMTDTGLGRWLRRLNPAGAPVAREDEQPRLTKTLTALGCVLGLVVTLFIIGIIFATAVYVAASVFLLGRRKPFTSIMIGLVVAAFCYGTFEVGLQVSLYKGLLFSAL